MSRKTKAQPAITFPWNDRLRMFTKQRYRTARLLSETTGIDTPALSGYFAGTRSPGFEQLRRLFNAGISLDWLMAPESIINQFSMDRPESPAPLVPRTMQEMSEAELAAELEARRRLRKREGGEGG